VSSSDTNADVKVKVKVRTVPAVQTTEKFPVYINHRKVRII